VARIVNEFAYCPHVFFYEWVESLFAESVDTVAGSIQHRRMDAKAPNLPFGSRGRAAFLRLERHFASTIEPGDQNPVAVAHAHLPVNFSRAFAPGLSASTKLATSIR
jgi:hypothetical protein